jgi:hypothetical protein
MVEQTNATPVCKNQHFRRRTQCPYAKTKKQKKDKPVDKPAEAIHAIHA